MNDHFDILYLLVPSVHPFVSSPRVNGNSAVIDITMKEAVEYLTSDDEKYKHCGASYIQHNTYVNDKAKEEVASNVTSSH